MGRAYICGTFDTKGPELRFLASCLQGAGVDVCTLDLSTRPHGSPTDVTAAEVAARHPQGAHAVFGTDDRGTAVAAMATAFARWIVARPDVDGVIGAGGSGAAALLAPGMQALPVGLPKLLISTIASGNTAPYVGVSDLIMIPSVTDVQGLNALSRRILANAAHALAGMIRQRVPDDGATRPAIGLTMFGVTTPCVQQVAAALQVEWDCVVFHAVGTGGRAMERLVDQGLLRGVIDVTTTEICDMMMGGIFPADETRFDAVIRTRVPCVVSCGALDMVNFGAPDTVPPAFRGRCLHAHNPQVTLMRTTAEENARMAEWMAAKLNRMEGEVRLLIPEGGVSALDVPGQPFHDPVADAALFDTLEARVVQTRSRRVQRLPCAVNDPAFAAALVVAWHEAAATVAARRELAGGVA